MILDLTKPPIRIPDMERQSLYSGVFGTEEGKKVLEDIGHASGFYRSTPYNADPVSTMYAEGARGLFLDICAQIQGDITILTNLMNEEENQNV